jgi:hypothetical protein
MKSARKRSLGRAVTTVELGEYIVADPKVCHGKVTFRGTRVFVSDVLEDVANSLSWEFIMRRWGNGNHTGCHCRGASRFPVHVELRPNELKIEAFRGREKT